MQSSTCFAEALLDVGDAGAFEVAGSAVGIVRLQICTQPIAADLASRALNATISTAAARQGNLARE